MSNDISSVYDDLARIVSEMDQVQALIEEARSLFANDQNIQLALDRKQTELMEKRDRLKIVRAIADSVYNK